MKFLLITDLDNTLVGDDHGTYTLNQKLLAKRDKLYLIYATGRSYSSALQLMNEKKLLEPDYWVTGVGTEIYYQGKRDTLWESHISDQWEPRVILNIAKYFKQLLPQSLQEQNPWKISFSLDYPENIGVIEKLRSKLNAHGAVYQLIFSSQKDIDIIPYKTNKGLAITYIRKFLQIPTDLTLVCGDSGNDINLFEQLTIGTIVSNAQRELLDWYQNNSSSYIYLAHSSYAWGILDGLEYFQLLK